jgi:dolichol-phosphate mannosyltransferase
MEVGNLEPVLRGIRASAPSADVLVVDDDSSDGTADLADRLAGELGAISVLRRSGEKGLGGAYRAGFGWGLAREYEVLTGMDADCSHDPASLPRLLAAIEGGADLAIGSRYVAGGSVPGLPSHRRRLSRWANRYTAVVLRLDVADITSGFRAYRSATLDRIDVTTVGARGYCFLVELAYRMAGAGGRIVEIPIEFHPRVEGRSKMSYPIIAESMLTVTWWGLRDRVRGSPPGPRRGPRPDQPSSSDSGRSP